MLAPFHRIVAYTLIVLLTIISGVGEGLHWIPGCGHATPVGDSFLLLGIDLADTDHPTNGRSHVQRPEEPDVPVFDEDECPVCSMVGQTCTAGEFVSHSLEALLVQECLPPVCLVVSLNTRQLFHARAPPLG